MFLVHKLLDTALFCQGITEDTQDSHAGLLLSVANVIFSQECNVICLSSFNSSDLDNVFHTVKVLLYKLHK